MTRFIHYFIMACCLLAALPTTAQDKPDGNDNKGMREKWFNEIKREKHKYLIRELNLTPEQQAPFFEIYDATEEKLRDINEQTRHLERTVLKKKDATDAEYDAAIEAIYNQKYREWTVESQAKEQYAKLLTKEQLTRLKRVEFKFTQALMKHRQSHKNKPADRKQQPKRDKAKSQSEKNNR